MASQINAEALSAERRGRFLMDVARARGQRRQAEEAVKALQEAEALTPEQVGTHRVVHLPEPPRTGITGWLLIAAIAPAIFAHVAHASVTAALDVVA